MGNRWNHSLFSGGGDALKGKDGMCMHATVHTCLQSCDYAHPACVESPAVYMTI